MTERASLEQLTEWVVEAIRARAAQYGLDPERVEARYILNWGGFVNVSFTIRDGTARYHLKLSDDPGVQDDLAQWQALAPLLEARYHAPKMLDWIEIEPAGFAGPLFEHIHGKPVDYAAQPGMLEAVLGLLERLHNDAELAEALREDEEDSPAPCWAYFLDVYIDRFDEDLRGVAAALPPFVSLALLDWMMGETRELEGLARDLPAFQPPAGSPTHGDLWSSNILVTPEGRWHVIDWDDLALGDPALEYSIVLGPLWRAGTPLEELAARLPDDPALRERFAVCLRAFLLDQVIDSLADWVEAGYAPEHLEAVRAEKEAQHRAALALYRERFGAAGGA